MNNTFNFATATAAELAEAGFTLTVKKSQAKTRRSRKSLIRSSDPSMNNAKHAAPVKAQPTVLRLAAKSKTDL